MNERVTCCHVTHNNGLEGVVYIVIVELVCKCLEIALFAEFAHALVGVGQLRQAEGHVLPCTSTP